MLSVLMVTLSVLPVIPVSADTPDGIRTSAREVLRDGTFAVEIVVPPSAVLADTMSVKVEYDRTAFDVVSWTSNVPGATSTPKEDCNGSFSASYGSSVANLDISRGVVMTAEMKVKSDAALKDYTFSVVKSDIGYFDSTGINYTQIWTAAVTEAVVTVKESTIDETYTVASGGLSMSAYQLQTGDEVYAYINIPALREKADTVSIRLSYDSTVFAVESWTSGIIGATVTPLEECDGDLSVSFGSSTPALDLSEGATCTAKLRVKNTAAGGVTRLRLTKYDILFCDDNGIDYHRLWKPVDIKRDATITVVDPDRIPVVGGGIRASKEKVQPGDTFNVYITIPAITHNADTAAIYADYDSDTFELISWNGLPGAVNTEPSAGGSTFGSKYDNGTADISLTSGKLLTAEFRVRNNAVKGTYSFDLFKHDLSYFDTGNVKHSLWTPGVITASVTIGEDPYPVTGGGIRISADKVTANETFNVYVRVPAIAKNAERVNMKVVFNEDVFSVLSVEPSFPGASTTIGNGYFSIVSDRDSDIYLGGGLTITATVRAKNAVSESYMFRLADASFSYGEGTSRKELWTPLTERASVTLVGSGASDDPYGLVHGGGIYVSPTRAGIGETFNVLVSVPPIRFNADCASFRVDYDPNTFELVNWEPYVVGGYATSGFGYFGVNATNSSKVIDLSDGKTFTAKMRVRTDAYTGNYQFELSGNGFTYRKDNGYEIQKLWIPDTYYANVYVYYGSGYARDDKDEPIDSNKPGVTVVDPSDPNGGTSPSSSDTTIRPPDDDAPVYIPGNDITIGLDTELDGLSDSRIVIKTKKQFFGHDVLVIIRRTSDSETAASYALSSLGLTNNKSYAFDISVYDTVTGQYIHSLGDGYITFDIPVPTAMLSDLSSLRLYHNAGGVPQRLDAALIYENGVQKIRFTANSFSPYMFVGGRKSSDNGGSGMIVPGGSKQDPGTANPHTGVAAAIIIPAALTGCVVLARKQSKRRRGRK